MYAVSDRYKRSFASPLREKSAFQMRLYELDAAAQYGLSLSATSPLQSGVQMLSIKQLPVTRRRATLEKQHMRADGQYQLEPSAHFIGGALSNGEADADGLYPYSPEEIVTLNASATSILRIQLERCVAEVAITLPDGSTKTVQYSNGSADHQLVIRDLPAGDTLLAFKRSFAPLHRVRIYEVLAGTATDWDGTGILSVEAEDENDLLCLELPGRQISVALDNLNGWCDPIAELQSPRFHRNGTQAFLTYLYDGEAVPLGRLFLDTYTVDREKVLFRFGSGLQPLSDYIHTASFVGEGWTAKERLQEVLERDPGTIVGTIRDAVSNPAQIYMVSASIADSPRNDILIGNPLPLVSEAACLQLVCNAAGLLIRPAHEGQDLQILPAPNTVVRTISYDELFSVEYKDNGTVTGAEISCTDLADYASEEVSKGVLASTEFKQHIQLRDPVDSSASWLRRLQDSSGNDIGAIYYGAQGYALYVWIELDVAGSYQADTGSISLNAYRLQESTVPMGSGDRKRLSNPLVRMGQAEAYWQRQSAVLRRRCSVVIRHRGFPELDCGDLIQVQLAAGGEYHQGHIVKNQFSYSGGVLSGTTEIRLLQAVG